jgi:glycine/D-amino acid oxidase-like deaminating enzyme
MKNQARVVVIGGGVVGCSILFHLTNFFLERCCPGGALGAYGRPHMACGRRLSYP